MRMKIILFMTAFFFAVGMATLATKLTFAALKAVGAVQ
jgi:hypothetical protein